METTFTEAELKAEIRRLAPFHHDVALPYGLRTHIPELSRREVEQTRLPSFMRHAWPSLLEACGGSLDGLRVLDVACNCGGFSVEAARSGAAHVLGIDLVDHYIEQANFIKNALGLQGVNFKKMALEDLDEATVGRFDVTFCLGILYHLENPVMAMKAIASVTDRVMIVDTKITGSRFFQKPFWEMNLAVVPASEAAPPRTESKFASTSLWRSDKVCQFTPNALAVTALLEFLGFREVRHLKPTAKGVEPRYYKGRRATFLALR